MKIAIVCLLVAAIVAVAVLANSSHVWKGYRDAAVTLNGSPPSGSRLYSSKDGILLIDMGNSEEWYAYRRAGNFLGYCHSPQLIRAFGYLYVRDETLPCVGYNEVKAEDAHLIIDPDYIEFDSRKGGRIRVAWRRAT